jgi:hypothetical protein
MPRRHLLGLIALLLMTGALAAALAPREVVRPEGSAAPPTGPRAMAPVTTGAPGRTVSANLPGPGGRARTVPARVGDLVQLSVAAPGPDSAALDGYGLVKPADATSPARFSLIAYRAGRFPVRLAQSRRVVGYLAVGPRG